MDTNKIVMVIFIIPFVLFGFLFLFWLAFDRWMSWKERRKMEVNHVYHVIPGLWSVLITYIGFQFYGKYSLLVGLIVATATAAFYFALSLWDIRFATLHDKRQEPSYLLYGFAKTYLLFIMVISCMVMLGGIDLLVVTWLNLSKDVRSYMALFLPICMYLIFYFLLDKKIPSWEKQSKG